MTVPRAGAASTAAWTLEYAAERHWRSAAPATPCGETYSAPVPPCLAADPADGTETTANAVRQAASEAIDAFRTVTSTG